VGVTACAVHGTVRSPDGEAGETEGIAGAAERGEDGGLESAVGDGADRVGVGEGRGGSDGSGGGEGGHGERYEEEAAVGHVAGGTGNIYFTCGPESEARWTVPSGRGTHRWPGLYIELGPFVDFYKLVLQFFYSKQ
jgi:hypothetical protein